MLGQIADWCPDMSQHCTLVRTLLKKGVEWFFTPEMRTEFENAKKGLTDPEAQRLRPFDPNLKCIVLTDASKIHGMGFLLLQEDQEGTKRIIKCGSVSLTPAQRNYSVTELEGLAVWYACNKAEYFLLGRPFEVRTDHRALVGIFSKEIREVDNLRLQKL